MADPARPAIASGNPANVSPEGREWTSSARGGGTHRRAAVVVPFRTSRHDPARATNLVTMTAVVATLGLDLVIAEHATPADPHVALTVPATVVRVPATGPFSKAAAVNAGVTAAAAAGAEVVVLADADTLVDRRHLLACVRRVAAGFAPPITRPHGGADADSPLAADAAATRIDAIRPFGRLVHLDPDATAAVAATGRLPEPDPLPDPDPLPGPDPDPGPAAANPRPGEVIPFAGGVVVVSVAAFWRAGGMDETFVGWGGEDDAFSHALHRTGATRRVLHAGVAFHLWHRRSPAARVAHPHYPANARRAAWWRDAPDHEIARAVASGRRLLAQRYEMGSGEPTTIPSSAARPAANSTTVSASPGDG